MKTIDHAAVALTSTLFLTTAALAVDPVGVDWPQWRGPDRTGESSETGWSANARDTPLWTKQIGFGHSSFAVSDGRLYAMGYDLERKVDVVWCLEPETGHEIWTHTYPADHWNEGHDGGTLATPTVHGDTVYVSNREGRMFALRAATGEVIWERRMRDELAVTPPRWGFSGSPVIIDDLVVANVGKLAAYDRSSGAPAWVTEKAYGNAYSTPVEYDFHGQPSLLVLNGLGLAAIDRNDGKELAFHPWTRNPERTIYGATPVIIDDDRIFISAASGGGCGMLRTVSNDDGTNGFEIVWESKVMRTDHAGGSILHDGYLYGFDASILKCVDLDGTEMWRQRGIGLGALSLVGGRLVVVGARGELVIAEATPERYVELYREKILDGGVCWSTPVLSHGLAYVRNSLGDMVCLDHRSVDPAAVARRDTDAGALPDAESLLDAHLKAIGGADALGALTAARFEGAGEIHTGGPTAHCDAALSWTADGNFVWKFSSGLEFGYTPELGWGATMAGPTVLDEDRIAEMREIGDWGAMLEPRWGFAAVETLETRVFDDRRCHVVRAEMADGRTRSLYFETETGLLAGREGDDVPLWVFDEYAGAGGVLVPMEWSFYDAQRGAMTLARFSDVTANATDESWYQPPLVIRMRTWSDEKKNAENERLRGAYGELVGQYKLATGSMVGTPISISIDEGGIRLSFGGGPPDFLNEPDANGAMASMSNPDIELRITRNSTDDGYDIVVWAYGDEFGTLERAETDG